MTAATTLPAAHSRAAGAAIGRRTRDRAAAGTLGQVWRVLAQVALVLLTVGGAAAMGLQIATWPDHPLADMTHVTWWARNIAAQGIERAFAGVYPETYMIYPPGMAYAYQAAIALSTSLAPYGGLGPDEWLRVCLKLVPLAAHTALAFVLFGIVAAAGGFWRGWAAATAYAWSPGALFDAAYWGQGDTLNTVFLVAAIGVLFTSPGWWPLRAASGQWRLAAQLVAPLAAAIAGVLLATAGLLKPQTWVFLPLVAWVVLRRTGPLGIAAAACAGAITAVWIVQPWVRAGRIDEMLSVFTNVTQVMPSVSANGHNLWWLKLPGAALSVFDTEPVGGFGSWVAPHLVNHATVGRLGFGLFTLVALLRLTGPLSLRLVMACAGYVAVAYFMTITQIHENHMFAAVPFLAAAAALDRWFIAPFVIASVCFFLNMTLHDFLIGDAMAATLGGWLPWDDALSLQKANATLNVAGFALLTLILLRRPPLPRQAARALVWRARLVLVAGAVVAGSALGALWAILRDPALATALWERVAARAISAGPLEAHLGRKTPEPVLLERAALDFANGLYTLAGIAAITGAVTALAGAWWLICAAWTRYHSGGEPRARVQWAAGSRLGRALAAPATSPTSMP